MGVVRVLVAAWAGSSNLGDELLLATTLGLLQERGAVPIVISADPKKTQEEFGVESVHHLNFLRLRSAFSSVDALVFGGGGLLQDETSRWNLPFHLARVKMADRRNIPWVGIGIGAAGIKTTRGESQVKEALGRHLTMVVRDQSSMNRLQGLGIERLELGADLAFLLPPPTEPPEPVTTVALRKPQGSSWIPGAFARQPPPDQPWISALAKALDEVATNSNRLTRFVAFESGSDDQLHTLVAREMRTPSEATVPSRNELSGVMAKSEACISMRYHGVITSALAEVPTVALTFSPKLASIAEELGQPSSPPSLEAISQLPDAVAHLDGTELAAKVEALRSRAAASGRAMDLLLGSL